MARDRSKEQLAGKPLRPESLMMSYGYKPELSEGALKCPIFQTSTFVFQTAEEGQAFFELAYGLREQSEGEELGLIYSRLNNPDLEILEDRLTLWDDADDAAVFESGMAAITTVLTQSNRWKKRWKIREFPTICEVDNTFLGPLWQRPLKHGADLVVYSATKFLGGHSDLIAGVVLGKAALMQQVKQFRTFVGNMASPWTGWLLMRSLETLKLRMTSQMKNARSAIFDLSKTVLSSRFDDLI